MIRYIKVHSSDPFVIVCDGDYDVRLALHRLDHDPFTFTKITELEKAGNLPEITLGEFLRMHHINTPLR